MTDPRASSTMTRVATALQIVFWSCAALLAYAQVGYPLLLAALARVKRPRSAPPCPS